MFWQEDPLTLIKLHSQKAAEKRYVKDSGGRARSPRLQYWDQLERIWNVAMPEIAVIY